jgi:Tfp pilus assembly protein PilX
MMTFLSKPARRQRGVALPVMLIMLIVMVIGSIYLFKSTHSTALTTGNLAYESALAKSVDLGLVTGFAWLSNAAKTNKATLNNHDGTQGYSATYNPAVTPAASGFWTNAVSITDPQSNRIQYVVHRLCATTGAFDKGGAAPNSCVLTSAPTKLNTSVKIGDSIASDAPSYNSIPQIHYMITARIFGPRGGNVVSQLVVMIGA